MRSHVKPQVLFVLSVDTEEEWDWKTAFPQHNIQVNNINGLQAFQIECDNLGIKPTYFVDYPVVHNDQSARILNMLSKAGNCEIGAHLHPWCNPPITAENGEFESHVVNLPIDLVEKKLVSLLDLLKTTFDISIKSFRTGRWGINSAVVTLLAKYGITVDSSVYPFYKNDYFNCNGAPEKPYWLDITDPLKARSSEQIADIFEIPVSVGFNHSNFMMCNKIHNTLSHPLLAFIRLSGIAWQLKLLRKLYLSPELTSLADMKTLIKVLLRKKTQVIHMNFHSSSLIDLPYKNHAYDRQQILGNMKQTISYLQEHATVTFCTISEAKKILTQSQVSQ
tara:strand:- start:55729 stop:56733 length:1005 start_codon:yes stop_codon:yes gene_type:complete